MEDHVDPYRYYLHFPSPSSTMELTRPVSSGEDMPEFFDEHEWRVIKQELNRLFVAFRTQIYLGQRHFAPSPTWRDELTLAGETDSPTFKAAPVRFVVRVHVFEKRGSGAGRYLGFVSLRPPNSVEEHTANDLAARHGFRYVLDAELTAPAHMQRPRYHLITTTASSARLGVLPFRSAVYSAAGATALQGSVCVHLAVTQALNLIMGRFACRPVSQVEFDCHLLEILIKNGESHINPQQRGAKPLEALQVIRDCCKGGGFPMWVEPRSEATQKRRLTLEERKLALRFLTDALACGLPVIAIVRAGHLLEEDVRKTMTEKGRKEDLDKPHAVLVLGMHLMHTVEEFGRPFVDFLSEKSREANTDCPRDDISEMPGRLIIHDTLSRGPYFECHTMDLLEAAEWAYGDPDSLEDREDRGVHFLVIGPPGLHMSHAQARTFAEYALFMILCTNGTEATAAGEEPWKYGERNGHDDCDSLRDYLEAGKVLPENSGKTEHWRFICRLLNAPEVTARYAQQKVLTASTPYKDLEEFPDKEDSKGHFWVVEVRHPSSNPWGDSHSIHTPAGNPPALVFIWNAGKMLPRSANASPPPADYTLRFTPPPPHGQPT